MPIPDAVRSAALLEMKLVMLQDPVVSKGSTPGMSSSTVLCCETSMLEGICRDHQAQGSVGPWKPHWHLGFHYSSWKEGKACDGMDAGSSHCWPAGMAAGLLLASQLGSWWDFVHVGQVECSF